MIVIDDHHYLSQYIINAQHYDLGNDALPAKSTRVHSENRHRFSSLHLRRGDIDMFKFSISISI